MGTTPNIIFNHLFSYTPIGPTFHTGIGEIYWSTVAATPPILRKIILGYPNTYILGIDYCESGGDTLRSQRIDLA
jgi:hypothetical protein